MVGSVGMGMKTKNDIPWIESSAERGVLVFKFLVKRLDSQRHCREAYRRAIDGAIDDGYHRVLLDFSNLRYTNHTWGLFQLVFVANSKLKEAGGQIAVCGMKGHVLRVFRYANLDRFIPAYRNKNQAIEAMVHSSVR